MQTDIRPGDIVTDGTDAEFRILATSDERALVDTLAGPRGIDLTAVTLVKRPRNVATPEQILRNAALFGITPEVVAYHLRTH